MSDFGCPECGGTNREISLESMLNKCLDCGAVNHYNDWLDGGGDSA